MMLAVVVPDTLRAWTRFSLQVGANIATIVRDDVTAPDDRSGLTQGASAITPRSNLLRRRARR